jgi:hypothetical protein
MHFFQGPYHHRNFGVQEKCVHSTGQASKQDADGIANLGDVEFGEKLAYIIRLHVFEVDLLCLAGRHATCWYTWFQDLLQPRSELSFVRGRKSGFFVCTAA